MDEKHIMLQNFSHQQKSLMDGRHIMFSNKCFTNSNEEMGKGKSQENGTQKTRSLSKSRA